MSQFEELISKYCPEGVPSFLLGSLLVANRGGGTPSTAKPEYWDGDIISEDVYDSDVSSDDITGIKEI